MRSRTAFVSFLVLVVALVLTAGPTVAGRKPEPKECVRLARTWDAAVEEAKLLSLPIVVHSHGFFCGPCWGMYASVMCNDKYMKFAEKNTVEVISLSRLQEGVDKEDARAETYEGMRKGNPVDFLVAFPGLTVQEMLDLHGSKAGRYNDTGKVPFTCLVNPHTQEEMTRWQGGTPVKVVMQGVEDAREALVEEHGKGFSRKTYRKITGAEEDAWKKVAKGDYAKAVAILDKNAKKSAQWPEALRQRLDGTRTEIVSAAEKALDAIETLAETDPNAAKKDLRKIRSKLKGTGLEERAAAIYAAL